MSPIKSQTRQFPFPHDSDICAEAPYIGKAKAKFRTGFKVACVVKMKLFFYGLVLL